MEIIGKTLELRSMNIREFHALCKKYQPDPVAEEAPYVYLREEADELFERLTARQEWFPVLGIFTKNNEIIGFFTFKRIVFSEKRCEIGIALASDEYKNKGYGTAALSMALKYAKGTLGLTRVYADTSSNNKSMIHLLEKLGFQNIRTRKNGFAKNGTVSDKLEYVKVL